MVEFSITDIQLIDGPADAKRSTKVRKSFSVLVIQFEQKENIMNAMINLLALH